MNSSSFWQRALPQFSSAIIDQVVLSGTNFLVGFLLIRFASDSDYALYLLMQSALLLLVSIHSAWLTGPLAILTPRLPEEVRWRTIGSTMRTQRRWLRVSVIPLLTLPLLGFMSGFVSRIVSCVLAIGIVAGWAALRREYLRSVLLIYSRPRTLLCADSAYAFSLLVGVSLALLFGKYVVVGATGALVLAAWVGEARAHSSLTIDPGWQGGDGAPIWPEIQRLGFWAVIGTSTYWFLGQSYSYLLATRLGLKAVADVNATRLLVSPAIVLTIGVVSLLLPSASRWYVQVGVHRLVRRLVLFALAVGLLEAVYCIVVWISRDWLLGTILHKRIDGGDRLLILWAGVALIALMRDVFQSALIAMGRLRSLAWQGGVSAAVAVLLMWFGMDWWGESAVLIGQIVGELINFLGIIILLRNSSSDASAGVLSR